MDALHVGHLSALVLWGAVLLVEAVLELGARTTAARRRAARVHYWIDVLVEAPVIAAVLATGAALTVRAWPPDAIVLVKIACGLVAVGVNAFCIGHVLLRYRRAGDPEALVRHGRRILLSGLGVPFALVAAYIGATRWLL